MTTINLSYYVAVPPPSPTHDNSFREILYNTIDDICAHSGEFPFPLEFCGEYYPTIDLVSDNQSEYAILSQLFTVEERESFEILKVSIDCFLPEHSRFLEGGGRFTNTYADNVSGQNARNEENSYVAAGAFKERIFDFFMSINIARPGALSVRKAVCLFDGEKKDFIDDLRLDSEKLRNAVLYAKKTGWPIVKDIDLALAWNWLTRMEGYTMGKCDFVTETALIALATLLSNPEYYSSLFLPVIGIEAMFVHSKSYKKKQKITHNVEQLFGVNSQASDLIGKLYDLRSNLVHGNYPLHHPYKILYQLMEIMVREKERDVFSITDAQDLALALNIATFQKLIEYDWRTINLSPFEGVPM